MGWTRTEDYAIFAAILNCLCWLVASILLAWYVRQLKNLDSIAPPMPLNRVRSRSVSQSIIELECCQTFRTSTSIIRYGTTAYVTTFWLSIAVGSVYRVGELVGLNGLYCRIYTAISSELWIFTRFLMFLVLLARLDYAYAGSLYAYSKRTVRILYISLILSYSMLVLWLPLGSKAERVALNGAGKNAKICRSESHPLLQFAIAVIDIGFNILSLILFIRPIRRLLADQEESRREDTYTDDSKVQVTDLEMKLVPLKYTVTTVTAVSSTFLALLFLGATRATFLLTFDGIINILCVLTMDRTFKGVFWYIFSPLLLCLVNHTSCLDDEHNQAVIQVTEYYRSGQQGTTGIIANQSKSPPRNNSSDTRDTMSNSVTESK